MPAVCLSLTGRTIAENLAVLDRYRDKVDYVELRADWLAPEEQFLVRRFPALAGKPVILTVRRRSDFGAFDEGEGVRLVIIAKALSYARDDNSANFAFVDLEDDFRVPTIEDTCRIFGTRIIRSHHDAHGVPADLDKLWREITSEPAAIPLIAVTPHSSQELARLIRWARQLPDREKLIIGMGDIGYPSRILAAHLGSMFSYCSATLAGLPAAAPGHIDPTIFESTYRGREVERNFLVYALAGGKSITGSRSPQLHNRAFREAGIDALYLPFPSDSAAGFLEAIEAAGARGAAVTVPLKEEILPLLESVSPDVAAIGACNTIRRTPTGWIGFNTDLYGFERSLLEFLGRDRLDGVRATIIGAGGAAKSVAAVLHRIGASCLILNRSIAKAKAIAQRYGFIWGPIDDRSLELISEYDDLIIQSTSVGMDGGPHEAPGELLDWYEFRGHEAVYDLVYKPERTPLLQRAAAAGCRVSNGYAMLCYQAAEQFRIWMGGEPPAAYLPPR